MIRVELCGILGGGGCQGLLTKARGFLVQTWMFETEKKDMISRGLN